MSLIDNGHSDLCRQLPLPMVEPPPVYPDRPGFKVTYTSMKAADEISDEAPTLRELTRNKYREIYPGGATPDEIAHMLEKSILQIRPRCSELKEKGELEPTGETRLNDSGKDADVLRLRVNHMKQGGDDGAAARD